MSDALGAAAPVQFIAGFTSRGQTGERLIQAFPPAGFAPSDLRARATAPRAVDPADDDPGVQSGGSLDPIGAAHAAGYAEGLADAAAADERDQSLADNIAAALSARVDRDGMARQLRQTVLFLVAKIVGETGVAPDILAGRVEAATDLLADAAESAMLRVHPDDVALLEGRLPATVFAVGDAAVARGGFVLESASTIVEDGPELWLDQLAAAIDRVAVPPAGRA